jgi:hypothetical protein
MTETLNALGFTQAHIVQAKALIEAAPGAQPSMNHEDWHAWAVSKFKVVCALVFNKEVEHWAANVIIGLVYGKYPQIAAVVPQATAQATAAQVIDAQSNASVSMTASPFTAAATQPTTPPQGVLAAVIQTPTNLTPQAP